MDERGIKPPPLIPSASFPETVGNRLEPMGTDEPMEQEKYLVLTLTLPWPPKQLSPNVRQHWSALARAKSRYRAACYLSAKAQGGSRIDASRLSLALLFVPPDKRRRDADNALAAMKAGLDGLADLFGVDDSLWRIAFEVAQDRTAKGGAVLVEVTAE